MSNIQIYYLIPEQLKRSLIESNVDLSLALRQGDKSIQQVSNEIKSNRNFCRDEFGIDLIHFKGSILADISLYASLDGKIAGLLTFMVLEARGKKMIMLNGICSPIEYAGLGVGKELINALIKIGRQFSFDYINLDCKGDRLMNYYKKFGFKVKGSKITYDSDDEDDEDGGHPYYNMRLDLLTTSGGRKNSKKSRRRSIRAKRKNTRRKLRKYH